MSAPPFIVGWLEWLALPELGLPAIKAKVDTGARTSALHAFLIEPFGSPEAPMVRFGVHPIPGRLDIAVVASAPIVSRREVTSSNGERETRCFIRTPVRLGGREWEIEVGLTNRESMSYRMLLGRQAIRDDMMVDVATAYRQPKLSYKLYRGVPRTETAADRPLRIALLASDTGGSFNDRLVRAAVERGHALEALQLGKVALAFGVEAAELTLDGRPLGHYDALIPRVGRREGTEAAAMVRQLEATGCLALNSGNALDRNLNRSAVAQALIRREVAQVMHLDDAIAPELTARRDRLRVLVVGGVAVAIIQGEGRDTRAVNLARHRAERRVAERAAQALELGLAAVELVDVDERPAVAGVSARPALGLFARLGKIDVARRIIEATEVSLRERRHQTAPD